MNRKIRNAVVFAAIGALVGCGGAEAQDPDQTGSVGQASSVHLKGGKNAEPSFVDNGLTLSSYGELSGLGEGDVRVELTARGQPTADCVNPGSGEHRPPGQNPAEVTLTGVQPIPATEIKNGNTPFAVTTVAPTSPVPGAPQCPNTQWEENITDVAFTSATIRVYQSNILVLTVQCSITPASSDGSIPGSHVSCTSS